MKNQSTGILRNAALTALISSGASSVALAGTPEPAPVMAPVEEGNVVSGSLSFDLNSHFVSYGADVWGGARSFGGDSTFNPSLELSWALTENFSMVLGTWWDVNDNPGNTVSRFGGDLQEVDIWAGGSYAFGDLTVSAIYQAWMYGGGTEHIVDIGFGYDCFLSPSLTIHNRVGNTTGNPGDNGTVLVAGIEHGFDLGPVSFSVPVSAGFFLTDDFHGAPGGLFPVPSDSGFGYASIGLNASYPLPFDDKFGEWDIHGGVTYFHTESDVIPFNPSDTFFTWNVGIGCSF